MPLLLSALLCVSDQRAAAKAEADHAMVLYHAGKFNEALDGFTHAYELFQVPGLLFNLGQCHRQLAHHQTAVFFYNEYLREAPNAPNHTQTLALRDDEQHLQDEEEAQSKRVIAVMPSAAQAPGLARGITPEPVTHKWWFWTAIGGSAVVVAAVVTTVVLLQPHAPQASLGVLDRQ